MSSLQLSLPPPKAKKQVWRFRFHCCWFLISRWFYTINTINKHTLQHWEKWAVSFLERSLPINNNPSANRKFCFNVLRYILRFQLSLHGWIEYGLISLIFGRCQSFFICHLFFIMIRLKMEAEHWLSAYFQCDYVWQGQWNQSYSGMFVNHDSVKTAEVFSGNYFTDGIKYH